MLLRVIRFCRAARRPRALSHTRTRRAADELCAHAPAEVRAQRRSVEVRGECIRECRARVRAACARRYTRTIRCRGA